MNKIFFILLALMFSILPQLGNAQDQTTLGREFWLTFPQNAEHTNWTETEEGLVISAMRSCQVVVYMYATGSSTTYTLSAGECRTVQLPQNNCYMTSSSQSPQNYVVRVTSTDTISLASYSHAANSLDASTVLPIQSLGSNYIVQTGSPRPHTNGYPYPSFFCVIATRDNTIVRITPSNPVVKTVVTHDALPFLDTLNAGEVIYLKSYNTSTDAGDLSGSLVQCLNNKPLAVFNGNMLLVLPQGCNSGDLVYEQAFPTSSWGRNFIVTKTSNRCADFVKVTSSDNNIIYINGTQQAIINHGDSYQFELTQDAAYVETTQPSCVYLYQTSQSYCPTFSTGGPSMVTIPPVEQLVHKSTFSTINPVQTFPYGNNISNHYINIVTSTSDASSIMFDGNALSGFTSIVGTPYSYKRFSINGGNHVLSTSGTGFLARIYGLGVRISYDYTAGTSFEEIAHINTCNIDGPDTLCLNEYGIFYTDVSANNILWDMDDGTTYRTSIVQHQFAEPGHYSVTVRVRYADDTNDYWGEKRVWVRSYDTTYHTITTTCGDAFIVDTQIYHCYHDSVIVNYQANNCHYDIYNIVVVPIDLDINVDFCVGDSVSVLDTTFREPGIYHIGASDENGCEVNYTIHVRENLTYNIEIDTTVCDNFDYWDNQYSSDGIYTKVFQTTKLCDSVVTVNLHVKPSYIQQMVDTVEKWPYYFGGQTFTSPDFYKISLTSIYGCDSIIQLRLYAVGGDLWFPNIVTPNQRENNVFKGIGNNISTYRCEIYNRMGERVATLNSLDESWGGTSKGRRCHQGTYVYQVYYSTNTLPNEIRKRFGSVTLIY